MTSVGPGPGRRLPAAARTQSRIAEQALAERCSHGAADFAWRHLLGATLHIDPTLLSPVSALFGGHRGGRRRLLGPGAKAPLGI